MPQLPVNTELSQTPGSPKITTAQLPVSVAIVSSPNVFTATQTVNNDIVRGSAVVANQPLVSITNSADTDATHFAGSFLLYGANGLGSTGRAWNFGVDTAATTPFRDFFLAKVLAGNTVSDPDGIYISNGGAGPASVGIGFAQPADSGRSVRLKVQGGSTTQGGLQVIQATTNTTVPPFSVTDTGAKDRVWIDPATAATWTLRLAGDTTTATVILSVQDLNTPATVPFKVTANGNVTIANPGANIAEFDIGNTAQVANLKTLATGEFTLGNNSAGALITLGNHLTGWPTIGFFGAAAVVQPSAAGTAAGYAAGATAATFHSDDTYTGGTGTTGYTINGIVAALKNLGLIHT